MNRSSVTPAASHKNDYLRRRFMITVTETIPSFETFSETLGYEPSGSLFFDIETTGFSPSSSLLFLVGTLELQEETWKLTQYLAEHPDDERRIVEAFFTSASRTVRSSISTAAPSTCLTLQKRLLITAFPTHWAKRRLSIFIRSSGRSKASAAHAEKSESF